MNARAGFLGAVLTLLSAVSLAAGSESGQTRVAGAGATFPAPLYQEWIKEYGKTHPDVSLSYDAVGSGEGVRRFLDGSADFGSSDSALSDADLGKVNPQRGALMIPTTAGMIVLAYHIPGVGEGLTLTRDVYVDIFAGRINAWNDPRIAATNPDLRLPNKQIFTVVRRDSSGTTFAMTNHLSAVSPWWKDQGPGVGKLVRWPGRAMTAAGNEGVAQRVKITDGAIGYMGYEFAHRIGLPMATLYNKAGNAIAPSPSAGQAALASVAEIPADLRVFLPDPGGAASYPIVTYTWLLLNERYENEDKARALKEALVWDLGAGQSIAQRMGFIPLPQEMVAKATETVARVH